MGNLFAVLTKAFKAKSFCGRTPFKMAKPVNEKVAKLNFG